MQGPCIWRIRGRTSSASRWNFSNARLSLAFRALGFLQQEFGTIPNVGDKIETGGWRFEIVNLDGRRIDKVLATRVEGEGGARLSNSETFQQFGALTPDVPAEGPDLPAQGMA